jgi:hypothetical protein
MKGEAMDVLEELESVGVLGYAVSKESKEPVEQVSQPQPVPALLDIRGPRMAEMCEQAVAVLGTLESDVHSLKELFEGLVEVWTGKKRIDKEESSDVTSIAVSGTIEGEEFPESEDPVVGEEDESPEGSVS